MPAFLSVLKDRHRRWDFNKWDNEFESELVARDATKSPSG
jgi:hypothetical protein